MILISALQCPGGNRRRRDGGNLEEFFSVCASTLRPHALARGCESPHSSRTRWSLAGVPTPAGLPPTCTAWHGCERSGAIVECLCGPPRAASDRRAPAMPRTGNLRWPTLGFGADDVCRRVLSPHWSATGYVPRLHRQRGRPAAPRSATVQRRGTAVRSASGLLPPPQRCRPPHGGVSYHGATDYVPR